MLADLLSHGFGAIGLTGSRVGSLCIVSALADRVTALEYCRAAIQMQSQLAQPARAIAACKPKSGVRPVRARALRGCRPIASSATQTTVRTTKKEVLKDARDDVRELIKSRHCNPILVRVAWHDSGTYDKVRGPRDASTVRIPWSSVHSSIRWVLSAYLAAAITFKS